MQARLARCAHCGATPAEAKAAAKAAAVAVDWVAMVSCRETNCAAMSPREGSNNAGAGGAAAAAACLAAWAVLVSAPVAIVRLPGLKMRLVQSGTKKINN